MDLRFGFLPPLHPPRLNRNLFGFPFDTGDPNPCPGFQNPYYADGLMLENAAMSPATEFQPMRVNDPRIWFYRAPNFHHGFPPELNYAPIEKLSVSPFDIGQQTGRPSASQKRFLVFDHSGDKTTLIYTSGIENPVQFGASCVPNPSAVLNLRTKNPSDGIFPLSPMLVDEKVDDNSRDILEDEMHEDTEELNALLCSDSDFSEDDEETSTGHSPSTMTDNYTHDLVEEIGEEVDSFSGSTKRRKLHDGGYSTISNTPSKTFPSSSLEHDAESSSSSGGKRSRKEKMRETVNSLQSIIPSAVGKEAIDVIDEAIRYLRFLKVKAKALGLNYTL